jgi:hypothetical protein
MAIAIRQTIKVMGDRFVSTEQDVAQAIEELKASMHATSEQKPFLELLPRPGILSPRNMESTSGA